jgi:hypothetical protein
MKNNDKLEFVFLIVQFRNLIDQKDFDDYEVFH